ncbi:MAG: Phospho-N-acetylmuramoyl-pentapeptide-transferase [Phycisphaerae bacterium]|nr:Phospho-N-acetylmuramoyl-pentapeptide-transferase [Phycisphaerae bacterium]
MLYHLFYWLTDGVPYAYASVLFRASCAILLSFFLVIWWGPRTIRVLAKLKMGDHPEFDHADLNELMKTKANVPTMGGILIMGVTLLSTLLLARWDNYYIYMAVFGMIWLTALGGIDDYFKLTASRRSGSRDGLKMYEKLLFQIGLGVLLGYFTYRHGQSNFAILNISGPLDPGQSFEAYKILAVPFYKHGLVLSVGAFMVIALLVITATSNAVNLTDGMDGLASGCTILCGFFFMILAFIVGDHEWAARLLLPHVPHSGELAITCGAVVGSCMGFLWYNCHPAKVFMGDAGSLPLGGLMGYVAIVTRQELMLLIVGGVFVIEAASVIMQVGYFKLTGGKRIFRVAPIHHHFHLSGWHETQVVTRFWLLAAVFAGLALASLKLR